MYSYYIVYIIIALVLVGFVLYSSKSFENCDSCNHKKLHSSPHSKDTIPLNFQKLWLEHMYYTREYIIRYVYHLPDLQEETKRLLQNQTDLAEAINSVYPGTFNTFKTLLDKHILIASKLVENADNNKGSLDEQGENILAIWQQNAVDIATALDKANSKYNFNILKDMLLKHLDTTVDEVVAIIKGYSGISEYDKAVDHMVNFSNYLVNIA